MFAKSLADGNFNKITSKRMDYLRNIEIMERPPFGFKICCKKLPSEGLKIWSAKEYK
jgi:hypothetical protein